ncbi:Uncharacterised protein [Mycobacteroides abscessus subsp. abscessus]|nr:Uncharacterised protein [Mycobacteroides abscessus subsp. abscessus]
MSWEIDGGFSMDRASCFVKRSVREFTDALAFRSCPVGILPGEIGCELGLERDDCQTPPEHVVQLAAHA